MKRLGTKHTNILPLKQSNAISSPKEPFYKMRDTNRRQCTPATPGWWWWGPDVSSYTQVHFFLLLLLSLCEGVLFACLGCERRTLAASKFLPEKRRSKTNRAVCIQVELNRRTTVWPAVRNILFQHWLHLKQTLSRHVHLGQKGEESEKKKV